MGRLRTIFPENAYVRRSRNEGLFVTDTVVETDLLAFEPAGRLFRARVTEKCLKEYENCFPEPPNFFCRTLVKTRDFPVSADALRLFETGLKLTETNEGYKEYEKAARQLAAVALRKKTGGAYACAAVMLADE